MLVLRDFDDGVLALRLGLELKLQLELRGLSLDDVEIDEGLTLWVLL